MGTPLLITIPIKAIHFWWCLDEQHHKKKPALGQPVTLAVLFAGQKDKFVHVPTVDQQEVDLMEALAGMEEDERLDDGAVEIDSADSRAAVESSAYKLLKIRIYLLRS